MLQKWVDTPIGKYDLLRNKAANSLLLFLSVSKIIKVSTVFLDIFANIGRWKLNERPQESSCSFLCQKFVT